MEDGKLFGAYRLLGRIGAGGMGEVWKAEDVALGRTVAIKILPAANALDSDANERFKREARTVAQLNHPNIAAIYAIDQVGDRTFIVMEFVDGEPLSRVIKSARLVPSEVAFVARRVAEALAEAHDKGIVHRDVKPDNIVVSGERVKVLDFGIAKRYGMDASGTATAKPEAEFRTETGIIVGTVQYMSPEQAMGKALDGRSDIFSLGVVMYEALTGRLPFDGDSPALTLTRIIRDDPPDVRTTRPGLSPKLGAVVMRCLEKEPGRRFHSARELAVALDSALPVSPALASSGDDRENETPTMRATPKPAPATVRRASRTIIEPAPSKLSALPWLVAMIAVVIASVAGTAWYLAWAKAPKADATTDSSPLLSPTPGTAIAVTTLAPDSSMTAVPPATLVDLAPTQTTASALPTASSEPTKAAVAPTRMTPLLGRSGSSGDIAEPPANASSSELADYYYRKGLQQNERRLPLEAYASFKKVVSLEPDNAAAWVRTGEIALVLRSQKEAVEDFKKAAQIGEGLDARDALIARFGSAISDGDVAAMDDACDEAPFDRIYNELRRMATKRGATDCPAPIGIGLEGGRGSGTGGMGRPPSGAGPPPPPTRRP